MADSFRKLVYKVSRELAPQDIECLVFIHKVPEAEKQRIKTGTDLFQYLQERGVISEASVESIKKVISQVDRRDLLKMLDKHLKLSSRNSAAVRNRDTLTSITSEPDFGVSVEIDESFYRENSWKDEREIFFALDCFCIRFHGVSITKPRCLRYGLFTVLIFFLLAAAIFWLGGPETVHTYLNAKKYRRDIGYLLIGVLAFMFIVFTLYLFRKRWPTYYSWLQLKRARRKQYARHRLRASARSEFEQTAENTVLTNDRSSSHPKNNQENPGFQNEEEEISNAPTSTADVPL